jgi:hypothetical protein
MFPKSEVPTHYVTTLIGTLVGLAIGVFISSKTELKIIDPSDQSIFVPEFVAKSNVNDVPWNTN